MPDNIPAPRIVAERVLALITDGSVIGLGSGRAASAFVRALGLRVRAGALHVRGVPTSQATADLATQSGIPLTTLEEVEQLDVDVDGADEVDPRLNLIKGLGGALVREKIVAAAAKRLIILVGQEKMVQTLGEHGKLPLEIVPFGFATCRRELARLGFPSEPRLMGAGKLFVTDNGNQILDCQVSAIADPAGLERMLLAIPGVVGTGLFLDMAGTVFVEQKDGTVRVLERGIL